MIFNYKTSNYLIRPLTFYHKNVIHCRERERRLFIYSQQKKCVSYSRCWNVQWDSTYYVLWIIHRAGIGRVALDVRLGCLGETLSSDSEPQKIIDAAKFALRNVALLELKAPYWRYIPTPLWSRYVRNMNYFIEWV